MSCLPSANEQRRCIQILHGNNVLHKAILFVCLQATLKSLFYFQEDFNLMCNNAMVYNAPETIYYKAAKKLVLSGSKLLSPVSMI